MEKINFNFSEYEKKVDRTDINYVWTDSFNDEVNQWCKEHICNDMHWGFQIISGDLPLHRDYNTLTKINYLLFTGGNSAATNFYSDDEKLVESIIIPEYRWHILKADAIHSVTGVDPGKIRFSITGRVF